MRPPPRRLRDAGEEILRVFPFGGVFLTRCGQEGRQFINAQRNETKRHNNVNFRLLRLLRPCIALAAATLLPLGIALAADGNATNKPKPYPLKTCIVTGDKLDGDMGKPVVFAYKGQEIKLCCKDCKPKFDKDPATYMKKLAEEVKKQAEAEKKPGGPASGGHDMPGMSGGK